MKFGDKISAERKRQGVSVQTLAEEFGISRSYLTLIENGRRLPGKKRLPRIAAALKVSVAEVLNWYLEDIRQKVIKA